MTNDQVRNIGKAQRLLIWAVVLSLINLFPLAIIITFPFLAYATWRMSSALEHAIWVRILLIVLMVIPFVSLLTILRLNDIATKKLKEAGYKVGLLGVDPAKLPAA